MTIEVGFAAQFKTISWSEAIEIEKTPMKTLHDIIELFSGHRIFHYMKEMDENSVQVPFRIFIRAFKNDQIIFELNGTINKVAYMKLVFDPNIPKIKDNSFHMFWIERIWYIAQFFKNCQAKMNWNRDDFNKFICLSIIVNQRKEFLLLPEIDKVIQEKLLRLYISDYQLYEHELEHRDLNTPDKVNLVTKSTFFNIIHRLYCSLLRQF